MASTIFHWAQHSPNVSLGILVFSWYRHRRTRLLSYQLDTLTVSVLHYRVLGALVLHLCRADPPSDRTVNRQRERSQRWKPLSLGQMCSWGFILDRDFRSFSRDHACLEWSLCGSNLPSPLLLCYIIKKCGQYSPLSQIREPSLSLSCCKTNTYSTSVKLCNCNIILRKK